MEYIYLIQEREFVRLDEPTYKIGRTTQADPHNRVKQYPKNSKLMLLCAVNDCVAVENLMMERFRELFEHRADYGNEYFTGDASEMMAEIFQIVVEDEVEGEVEETNNDSIIELTETVKKVTTIETSKKYKCKKCGKGFAEYRYLNQHHNRKTPCDKVFQCKKCFKTFPNNRELFRHEERKTPCAPEEVSVIGDNEENRCQFCNRTYSTKGNLKRHQQTCDNNDL